MAHARHDEADQHLASVPLAPEATGIGLPPEPLPTFLTRHRRAPPQGLT